MTFLEAFSTIQNEFQTYIYRQFEAVAKMAANKIEGVLYSLVKKGIDFHFKDDKKILQEIRKIDLAIETLDQGRDEIPALSAIFPQTVPPDVRSGMSWEERLFIGGGERGVGSAQSKLRLQLIEALKTHRVSSLLLTMGVEKQRHLLQMKSEFMRLQDLLTRSARRPNPDALREFASVRTDSWQAPGVPVTHFEDRSLVLRYPKDTDENSRHAVVTTEGKLVYSLDTPWAQTLRFLEEKWLAKPMKDLSVNELKKLFSDIHHQLGLVLRARECCLAEASQILSTRSSIQQAFKRWGGDFHLAARAFSAADWEALSSQNFVAPAPEKIDELLQQFFDRLHMQLQDECLHPFQVASFIHWALTRIRPFKDGNGSLIRLFMNVYLMQSGYTPLVVERNREYLKPFSEANYMQAFGDFLNRSITRGTV